jgi:hypothetical protein
MSCLSNDAQVGLGLGGSFSHKPNALREIWFTGYLKVRALFKNLGLGSPSDTEKEFQRGQALGSTRKVGR